MSEMASNLSNSSQKRPATKGSEHRGKRAKYTSAACNECKRCKVKCIRMEGDIDCQRCTTMKVACVIVPTAAQSAKESNKEKQRTDRDDANLKQLSNDIHLLRQQVGTLTASVATLIDKQNVKSPKNVDATPEPSSNSPAITSSSYRRECAPQQPQFVGPTRSAFSFNIAETSLSKMDLPTDESVSDNPPSAASSRDTTPEVAVEPSQQQNGADILANYSTTEIVRFLGIYQEEIGCVHPIVETENLIRDVSKILGVLKSPNQHSSNTMTIGWKDVHILKIAVATSLIHEYHGKNEISDKLVESVERDVGVISLASEVELKDIQIMGMLSLYFCHTAEELFAWRAIGRAARQALEMGLHRRQSLIDNFKDLQTRKMAVHIFWVVYELDRRWSFGTSLSFALNDRDIDPQLPEPGKDYPYLKSMVAYARLCSRVWEALPPYGSSLHLIPKETEDYLDFITQNWLESVPQELQFKHPRLGLATRGQPRHLHRLRTLLYLRGNHVRTLIHRHHVLTPENIKADLQSARLAVDIAKDSIHVLLHLNESSDVYIREQSIYHYYLLSALAVVLLAVCHGPQQFAESCRGPFTSAIELVKGFSRHSTASRRLWKSIRGLIPVVKSLGNRATTRANNSEEPSGNSDELSQQTGPVQNNNTRLFTVHAAADGNQWPSEVSILELNNNDSMPDIFDMSNDLLDFYDVFGSTAMEADALAEPLCDNFGEQGMSTWEINEISRHFQGLI